MTETAPVIIQLEAGKLVDKYTVVKKLGEGTFGAVYAVQDAKGNKYALKAESVNERVPVLHFVGKSVRENRDDLLSASSA
ncbi:hypothetical protein Y032_0139g2107 [Ancylostoma ceylanicum]|uniref:Protein kinase domain-containing protein n=1 Tax=Ancylostoma ceylanicum TaxID=53326 RepID=A0A016T4P0_9BILA|nr:hypothetical protein Y032_0139g2107 [Ancylostoma ceylanicum]